MTPQVAPASVAKDPGKSSEPESEMTKQSPLLEQLQIQFKSRACVAISESSPCYESVPELLAAMPDLAEQIRSKPAHANTFASLLHWLEQGRFRETSSAYFAEAQLVTGRISAQKTADQWLAAPDLKTLESWRAEIRSEIPAIGELPSPGWRGNTFVASALFLEQDLHSSERVSALIAVQYEVDFDKTGETTRKRLPGKPHDLKSHRDAVTALFGGPVDAFLSVPASDGHSIFVAIGAHKGASPFVSSGPGGSVARYRSWKQLEAALPQAATRETIAKLAKRITAFFSEEQSNVIVDAAAYKDLYRKNNWKELKLRYWHDELRVTQYTIADFDTIADPKIENEKLVVFCQEQHNVGREPTRLEMRLSKLTLKSQYTSTAMALGRVVSDTGVAGDLQPRTVDKVIKKNDEDLVPILMPE